MAKVKSLGQIAWEAWMRDDGIDGQGFDAVAAAVICAYERRKPCGECCYYVVSGCYTPCRWNHKNNFKPRRGRKP